MYLTVQENDRHIRTLFPSFKLVLDAVFIGIWEGELKPMFRTYKVRITYFPRKYYKNFTLRNPSETIIVLDPPIGGDPRGTGERAQHTYYWDCPPDFPRLCVHDPIADDWNRSKPVAETLIPYTIDWLLWHEDWVATGLWRGRGRHPTPPSSGSRGIPGEERSEWDTSLTAEFERLGRAIGYYCSYDFLDLTGAAYFAPLFATPLDAGPPPPMAFQQ